MLHVLESPRDFAAVSHMCLSVMNEASDEQCPRAIFTKVLAPVGAACERFAGAMRCSQVPTSACAFDVTRTCAFDVEFAVSRLIGPVFAVVIADPKSSTNSDTGPSRTAGWI